MVINVNLHSLSIGLRPLSANEIVDLNLVLCYSLFKYIRTISFLIFTFLQFVSVLMVDTVIKVLVVQFFVVPIEFSDSWVEPDHKVLITHEAS
jgi:antibiotic biosynthesis monooxygenase (ABM) superfamily enzyme